MEEANLINVMLWYILRNLSPGPELLLDNINGAARDWNTVLIGNMPMGL
jgi:hypothetical protein